jgi:hypothetical protein
VLSKQIGLLVLGAILLTTESLSTTGCSSGYNNAAKPPDGWVKVEAGAFLIYAPPGWELHKRQGIDSYVGEFAGDGVVLSFDFGEYSNSLEEFHEPTYVVTQEFIGGYKARIVSPRTPGHGVTGIYFPRVTGSGSHRVLGHRPNSLCLNGQDLTDTQQELALKIFRTIQFK